MKPNKMCQKCKEINSLYNEITQDSQSSLEEDYINFLPLGSNIFIKYIFGISCLKFWWQLVNCLEALKDLVDEPEKVSVYKKKLLKLKERDVPYCECSESILELEKLLSHIPYPSSYHEELEGLKILNSGSGEFIRRVAGLYCLKCELIEETIERILNDNKNFINTQSEPNFLMKCYNYLRSWVYE